MGDWSSTTYIISQIFVGLGFCFLGSTYLVRHRFIILCIVLCASTCMITGYAFMGAWVGLGMCCVAIVRDITHFILDRKRTEADRKRITKLDTYLLGLWSIMMVAVMAFTQEGFMTMFAFFAQYIFMVSIWQKKLIVYRVMGIFSGVCWFVYNIYNESLVGIIFEGLLMVVVIIGIVSYIIKDKKAYANRELFTPQRGV